MRHAFPKKATYYPIITFAGRRNEAANSNI
jgi:hypothetical protein